MRLLLDMNISWRFVSILNNAGFEAFHCRDIDLGKSSDDEVFDYARDNGMVLITNDFDFGYLQRIRTNYHPKFGILLLTNNGGGISPDKHHIKLIAKLKKLENELINGNLLKVDLANAKPRLQLIK